MLRDNERSSESSESEDQELYDLRHDYLQKLNIVRKRLNLIEIGEDDSTRSSGCKITEIIDDEEQSEKETLDITVPHGDADNGEISENSEGDEVKTIHPFSLVYTTESKSATDMFEMEYNPPKKKSCYRLQTPKLPSSSESSIAYHTKVTLHEGLFKNKDSVETIGTGIYKKESRTWSDTISKFTATKETQCSEQCLHIPENSISNVCLESNTNLFPEVIIKETTKEEASSESSSKPKGIERILTHAIPSQNLNKSACPEDNEASEGNIETNLNSSSTKSLDQKSKSSSLSHHIKRTAKVPNFLMNSTDEPSEESYNTVSTGLTTVVENNKVFPKKKKRLWKRNQQRQTMWDDLQYLQSGDGVFLNKKTPKKRSSFLTQFTNYKKEKHRAQSCPIGARDPIPFGPVNLNNFGNCATDNFFYFSTDTDWHSSRFPTPSEERESGGKFWRNLFSCCGPLNIFKRNKK